MAKACADGIVLGLWRRKAGATRRSAVVLERETARADGAKQSKEDNASEGRSGGVRERLTTAATR